MFGARNVAKRRVRETMSGLPRYSRDTMFSAGRYATMRLQQTPKPVEQNKMADAKKDRARRHDQTGSQEKPGRKEAAEGISKSLHAHGWIMSRRVLFVCY